MSKSTYLGIVRKSVTGNGKDGNNIPKAHIKNIFLMWA